MNLVKIAAVKTYKQWKFHFLLTRMGRIIKMNFIHPVTKNTRQQLTLFVDKQQAAAIEYIRRKFNPKQYQLIASHVTLCREDELHDMSYILARLQDPLPSITVQLGPVCRFQNGQGVLLPAAGSNASFHQLRNKLLKKDMEHIRLHHPHITLMHPRNSTCTDDIFKEIQSARLPACLTFKQVSLIEQTDGGKWQTIQTVNLTST